MCGISGFYNHSQDQSLSALENSAGAMADVIAHRGPDGSGVWADKESGVALSHRRLSIIDLSQNGHQPMVSASERYVMSFNGEIYNFQTLKTELESGGHTFRGHSDTEVLLAAIEAHGLKTALSKINGMFAFALWDKKTRTLSLARDRLGKKPLYYGWARQGLIFGSELKALKAVPDFRPKINQEALALYMRRAYVPAPFSIYQDVYKLPPGCVVSIKPEDLKSHKIEPEHYWDFSKIAQQSVQNPLDLSDEAALDALENLLDEAVKTRMISDVSLGAFLSGGIDSSLVTALMQKHASNPVKTFSIGFEENKYNEAEHAKNIAQHLGTDHTEFYVSADQTRDIIPNLPDIYDEPFADPSQVPTYVLSKLAREHVTVALSGDGGDESFCGYERYTRYMQAHKLYKWPFRGAVKGLLDIMPLPGKMKARGETVSYALGAADEWVYYERLMSYWKAPLVLQAEGAAVKNHYPDFKNFQNKMMYHDTVHYLPDDILTKVDRASMAASLEVRAPLLDSNIVEFAWTLPPQMKTRQGQDKWILQALLERHIPRVLFDRPKQGFGIPQGEWLRGPLRDWAESLLAEKRLKEQGLFDAGVIRQQWADHIEGRHDRGYNLWVALMFQAWHDRWADSD